MPPSARDWTVPAPLSALLWWPGLSFVIVLVAPDLAAGAIAVTGLVLAALGAALARLRRSVTTEEAAEPVPAVRTA
jgi:hypothetical protein